MAAYSYKGDYRNISGKTAEQNIEISQEHVEKMIKRNHLVPICTEHDTIKIGEVVNTYQKDDGSVWVDFELDDTSTAGNTAHQLVKSGLINNLSWNHDWNDLQPVEVSLTFKPGREGTNIERPPQQNNSQHYIHPNSSEAVTHSTPSMMAANADSVASGSAAPAATPAAAPAEQAAPVTTQAAPASDSNSTPAFDALTKQYPGLANLPEHHKLNLKHIVTNNMLTNEQRAEMIDSVMTSIKAEQENVALLKEKENELRKLKEENSSLSKDRHQGRQQFHTLVENLVKAHAPHLITDDFSNTGKQYISEDANKWIEHVQPAMMACNMEMLNQKSKQQELWMKKLEAVNDFMNNGESSKAAPAMVQANYQKSVGSKRSAEDMMSNNASTAPVNSAAASFVDRIPMSAESRSLFAKWGSMDAGMDIRPSDIGFDARRLAVKEQV